MSETKYFNEETAHSNVMYWWHVVGFAKGLMYWLFVTVFGGCLMYRLVDIEYMCMHSDMDLQHTPPITL